MTTNERPTFNFNGRELTGERFGPSWIPAARPAATAFREAHGTLEIATGLRRSPA